MNAETIAKALGGHRSGRGWLARCPAHDDRNPSLSIRDGGDGKVLVYCHAGCSQEAVVAALKDRGLWNAGGGEAPVKPIPKKAKRKWTPILPVPADAPRTIPDHQRFGRCSAYWAYCDAVGQFLFVVCRFGHYGDGKDILPLTYCRGTNGRREWRWQAPPTPRPLYGLDRLARCPDAPVLVVEGEKAADAAQQHFPDHVAMTWPGGCNAVAKADWSPLRERSVVVWPDSDKPGMEAAKSVAAACHEAGASDVRIVELAPGLPEKWDLADPLPEGWTLENLRRLVETAKPISPSLSASGEEIWPEPSELPPLTPTVPELPEELLPEPLRPWLVDVAERIQIPLEFVAVPAIVALSALIGRRIGIYPKRKDDWFVVPNLWGMVIARPGLLKSPAIAQALAPLKRLAAQAMEEFRAGEPAAEALREIFRLRFSALQQRGKIAARKGQGEELADVQARMTELKRQWGEADTHERRYIVNDATVEKIGELLNQNPRGLLLVRDELPGLLRSLDKPGREGDREFYLEAWNGDGGFVYDRIGRGTIHVPALTLSIVGTIQPGKLWTYVNGALQGERADDGLLQRFQLVVWPDPKREWQNVDRWPDSAARDAAFDAFERLDNLNPKVLGATASHDGIPALRFGPDAQELFDEWRADSEAQLRTPEMESFPAFESHLAKYRSLMPSLALIFHLIEFVSFVGESAPSVGTAVGLESAKRAAAWCEFLKAHARKVYAAEINADVSAAHALADKIKAGVVEDGGNVRNLYRPQWSGLRTPEAVWEGLMVLQGLGWLRIEERETGARKADVVVLNPKLREAKP